MCMYLLSTLYIKRLSSSMDLDLNLTNFLFGFNLDLLFNGIKDNSSLLSSLFSYSSSEVSHCVKSSLPKLTESSFSSIFTFCIPCKPLAFFFFDPYSALYTMFVYVPSLHNNKRFYLTDIKCMNALSSLH